MDSAEVGRVLRYRNDEWYVAEKTVNRESDGYLERQWTLRRDLCCDHYLIKTEEKKASGPEVIWVLTSAIRLDDVAAADQPGTRSAFSNQDSMPETPPAAVRYSGNTFTFAGRTSVMAADDEGDIVPKITWDYYSGDRRRNLAIEIWKEPDKDYPEAYLGDVVLPSAFSVLDKKVDVVKFGTQSFSGPLPELQAAFMVLGMFGMIFVISGLPVEYIFAFGVPLALWGAAFILQTAYWLLAAAGCLLAVVIAAGYLGGFMMPFWHIAAGCLAISSMLPKLLAGFFPDETFTGHFRVGLYGALPALWLYSFTEYMFYAPGPHTFYQFSAAALLPLAAAAVCSLVNFLLEGKDARP